MNKNRIMLILTVAFCFCFGYIIYSANTSKDFFVFTFIDKFPHSDKAGHFILMLIFSFLLNSSLKNRRLKILKPKILLGSLIVFSIITIEEFSQLNLDNRSFDLLDLACNYLGIVVGGFLSTRFYDK